MFDKTTDGLLFERNTQMDVTQVRVIGHILDVLYQEISCSNFHFRIKVMVGQDGGSPISQDTDVADGYWPRPLLPLLANRYRPQ